jgi:hypothetical protein
MTRDQLPEPQAAITKSGERIAEAIADLIDAVSPPLTPREDHLTAAVLEVACELKGIRCLLARFLNEYERANDEREEA